MTDTPPDLTGSGPPSEPFALREEDLNWRVIGDELIVLDLRAGTYLSVNASGMLLWNLIAEGPATRSALVTHLAESYAISEETARRDVDAFITLLAEHGFFA